MEQFICRYCESERKNKRSLIVHERTCPSNANRKYKNGMTGKTAWNKGLTKETCEITKQQAATLKHKLASGEIQLSGVAVWDRDKRREHALKNNFGGYNEHAGCSKKFYVDDSFGNRACLQSTYELRCSEILNDLGIKWIRPQYLNYNNGKKYFPDFYLVDYDIYLDPKNDFLVKKDREKIAAVCEQNKVTVLILTEDKLTKDYIRNIVP